MTKNQQFEEELTSLLNRHCKENGCDTPDWLLARYLINCLDVFDMTVNRRSLWYGRPSGNGISITGDTPLENPVTTPSNIPFDFDGKRI